MFNHHSAFIQNQGIIFLIHIIGVEDTPSLAGLLPYASTFLDLKVVIVKGYKPIFAQVFCFKILNQNKIVSITTFWAKKKI